MLTNEQIERVKQAIKETETLRARELCYLPANQNMELIAFYDTHLTKLNEMLIRRPAAWWLGVNPEIIAAYNLCSEKSVLYMSRGKLAEAEQLKVLANYIQNNS